MNIHTTHLEDLSNEIFFEIFDYLDALQIFTGFTSLNRRISSILQSVPLRIVISSNLCRCQIDFLSSQLTFHAHQVISLEIYDRIRDYSSIISLLFNRHNFLNLESCTFISINPSTKFENVIKQIKNLNRLVSFSILQVDKNYYLNENDKCDLTRIILMHKSSSLRSIVLHYPYDYSDISNYTSLPSNLISFKLIISGLPSTVSVYSILSILRFCHTVRYLCIILEHEESFESIINDSIQASTINDNDLPILPQMISFDLTIVARCDYRSIGYVLSCMPNLRQFYFQLIQTQAWPFPGELLDGYVWKQIFELYVPYLSKFEFHMSIEKRYPKLDLDIIVNSFGYFIGKYSNWHMIIDRWRYNSEIREEYVMLRTLNYHKYKSNVDVHMSYIYSRSFQTRSTTTTNDHQLFYSDVKYLMIYMTKRRPTVTWSSPLYPQISYLIIEMPIIRSSLWNRFFNIVNFLQTTGDDDAQQCATYLSYFLHLPNVTQLKFGSTFDIHRWKDVQFILQACLNVVDLVINTRLLLLTKLIDNSSLMPIFKQIKTIVSITEDIYFPSCFALKFVQRFPSLNHVELQVFSFDNCVSVIDIFLTYLKNLSYIGIIYYQDTLLDDPFSRDYIIEKRRQAFPLRIINEEMINVINNGEYVEIWL